MPHRIIWSWYTGRWRLSCYMWYSKEGTGWAVAPLSPLLTVPNVTAHPSAASVPITVMLYDSPLLCGFNVAIKGLILHCSQTKSYIRIRKLILFLSRSEMLDRDFATGGVSVCPSVRLSHDGIDWKLLTTGSRSFHRRMARGLYFYLGLDQHSYPRSQGNPLVQTSD